jgi:hypothetical protein
MCHHRSIDWTDADEDETETETKTEAAEERPPAFDDDREVDVEILTDGGDE